MGEIGVAHVWFQYYYCYEKRYFENMAKHYLRHCLTNPYQSGVFCFVEKLVDHTKSYTSYNKIFPDLLDAGQKKHWYGKGYCALQHPVDRFETWSWRRGIGGETWRNQWPLRAASARASVPTATSVVYVHCCTYVLGVLKTKPGDTKIISPGELTFHLGNPKQGTIKTSN